MRGRSLLLASILVLAGCAHATAGSPQQSYVWYDGNQARQIWLDPGLVAEFGASARTPAALREAGVRAQPVSSTGGARLWRVGGTQPDSLARRLNGIVDAGSRFSPVLRDQPGTMGPLRALPGNVIVYLDPTWDMPTIGRWLAGHNLVVIRELPVRPNAFLIKTAPGLEALSVANALYRSGQVVAAFPDWWQAVATR